MPQFLQTHSPWGGVADEMQQILLERAVAAKQAEAEAYKRQQDMLKFGLDAADVTTRRGTLGVAQGRLVLDTDVFNADAPKRAADVANTQSIIGQRNQQTDFSADDRARTIRGLSMLPESGPPGRPSPRVLGELKAFGNVDFMTPSGERATVAAPTLGAETGQSAAAAWNAGGRQVESDRERIRADADIRVANAKQRASEAPAAADTSDADRLVDEALSAISTLRKQPGKEGAVGAHALNWRLPFNLISEAWQGRPVGGSPEADYARQFESLKAKVTLPNLKLMKGMGALSDAEGKRIEAASIVADRATSEVEFDRAMNEMEAVLTSAKQRRQGRGVGLGLSPQTGQSKRVFKRDATGKLVRQ